MAIAWIDIVILALIALSAILSLFRGFVTEALALASWLVALPGICYRDNKFIISIN